MNEFLRKFIKSKIFYQLVLSIIILNAIVIGLQTSPSIEGKFGALLDFLNITCSILFIIEFTLRIYVHRLNFFKEKWDVFDLIIVLISIVPETSVISVFRFLRVTRILRLVSVIPKIQFITQILLRTLSSMVGIGFLLMIVYYIYAVITTTLYGQDFPALFGNLGESYYTLFQIMTFDSWSSGIVRPVMEVHPYSWVVFSSFLIIATYIVLNIVIGIIVDCIGEIKDTETGAAFEKSQINQEEILRKIDDLDIDIRELKILLSEIKKIEEEKLK